MLSSLESIKFLLESLLLSISQYHTLRCAIAFRRYASIWSSWLTLLVGCHSCRCLLVVIHVVVVVTGVVVGGWADVIHSCCLPTCLTTCASWVFSLLAIGFRFPLTTLDQWSKETGLIVQKPVSLWIISQLGYWFQEHDRMKLDRVDYEFLVLDWQQTSSKMSRLFDPA